MTIATPGSLAQPPKPVGFEIVTMDQMKLEEATKMLYYGSSGVGKTMFVGSAGPRTFIVNIGNGLKTIQSQWAKEKFYKDGMPLVCTIQEERDPATGVFKSAEAYDKVCDAIDYALNHYSDRFDTVAVDDATQFRVFAANKGLEVNADFSRSKTLEMGRKAGAFIAGVQDFAAEMSLIQQFLAGTGDLCVKHNKHFLMTAQERHIYKKIRDNSGKVIGQEIDKIRPGFTGQTFPDEVDGFFDLMWNATVTRTGQGPFYRAWTESTMTIKAKSRYPGVFQNPEPAPNFLNVIERIKNSRR